MLCFGLCRQPKAAACTFSPACSEIHSHSLEIINVLKASYSSLVWLYGRNTSAALSLCKASSAFLQCHGLHFESRWWVLPQGAGFCRKHQLWGASCPTRKILSERGASSPSGKLRRDSSRKRKQVMIDFLRPQVSPSRSSGLLLRGNGFLLLQSNVIN